ncbi:MAG: hypothetical protein KGL69_12540 [Alphaproteobacteria bacterium]|jgi:hypothetical protein|nr:hypothetical protein [Alphaproteobacteria bacterium]
MAPTRFAVLAATLLTLGACSKVAGVVQGGARLPSDALDSQIAEQIGDPTTCVLLADPRTGKVVYRYGELFNCVRGLPACDRPGVMTATEALRLATTPGGRAVSCPTTADGSRMVGWTEGVTKGTRTPYLYSAVMEGQRALPGHEMAARLAQAVSDAGL